LERRQLRQYYLYKKKKKKKEKEAILAVGFALPTQEPTEGSGTAQIGPFTITRLHGKGFSALNTDTR